MDKQVKVPEVTQKHCDTCSDVKCRVQVAGSVNPKFQIACSDYKVDDKSGRAAFIKVS